MRCSYHPTIDTQETCSVCRKAICAECAHKVKGKPYCQECLVEGAEWAATVKGLRLPADAPRRAAICAVIPGLGAVYNNEYTKAITFFAVFAALSVMGSRIHGIFGFGAFVFLLFTIFEAYRSAEFKARKRLQTGVFQEEAGQDKTIIGWGIILIVLGVIFLLQNYIGDYLNRLWPVLFIVLGGYLVFRAIQSRQEQTPPSGTLPGRKEEL